MTTPTLEQVASLAAQLTPAERLQLVERIAHDLASAQAAAGLPRRRLWREIRGTVAYPFLG